MKIRKTILLIIFVQCYIFSFAQDTIRTKCGTADFDTAYVDTLPWYGNNGFLVQFYDSLRALHPGLNPDTTTYKSKLFGLDGVENTGIRIPVQFWVYNNPNVLFPNIYISLQGIIDVLNFQFRDVLRQSHSSNKDKTKSPLLIVFKVVPMCLKLKLNSLNVPSIFHLYRSAPT